MARRQGTIDLDGAPFLDVAGAAALRTALQAVLAGRPAIRGASVYGIARGGTVVRLVTERGWIPVMLQPSDWADVAALVSRLEAALAPSL